MPKYEFVCEEGHENVFKIGYKEFHYYRDVGPFCNTCGDNTRLKIGVVGILFKGAGFTVSGRV